MKIITARVNKKNNIAWCWIKTKNDLSIVEKNKIRKCAIIEDDNKWVN